MTGASAPAAPPPGALHVVRQGCHGRAIVLRPSPTRLQHAYSPASGPPARLGAAKALERVCGGSVE